MRTFSLSDYQILIIMTTELLLPRPRAENLCVHLSYQQEEIEKEKMKKRRRRKKLVLLQRVLMRLATVKVPHEYHVSVLQVNFPGEPPLID